MDSVPDLSKYQKIWGFTTMKDGVSSPINLINERIILKNYNDVDSVERKNG
jgi:hypothetical protein